MSAPLTNHVNVNLINDSTGVERQNFDVALLVSYNASSWLERQREYNDLAAVQEDFPSTTGPEYLAAARFFGQTTHPEKMIIARGALPPTKRFTLTPVVLDSTVYQLRVGGDGVTEELLEVTSDADATATEICDAMRTELNAVVGKNFTATGTTTIVVTGDAAGEWFWIEVLNRGHWDIVEDHTDPGIATDLAAINVEESNWYWLLTMYNSDAMVKAAALWIEATKKQYSPEVVESDTLTVASDGTQGTLDDLMTLGYERTWGVFHPRPAEMGSVGWVSDFASRTPGSATAKFKQINGVSEVVMTATERANLRARNANSFEKVAGVTITFEGTTTDGEFIDARRDVDWLEDRLSKGAFLIMVQNGKIPYTDGGINAFRGDAEAALREAVDMTILADDPTPTVTVPKASTVSAANKQVRLLDGVKVFGTLAGAVHKLNMVGIITS